MHATMGRCLLLILTTAVHQGTVHTLHCMQVLQELVGDRSLERFRVEYEKLYRALKKSHGKYRINFDPGKVCMHQAHIQTISSL